MGTTSASDIKPPVHTPPPRAQALAPQEVSRRAVDAPTRTFHLLLTLCVVGAHLTGDIESWKLPHVTLGHTLAGLLGFRLIWGLLGPRAVRWSAWVGQLRRLSQARADVGAGRLASPAVQGVTMTATRVGLLGMVALTIASGWVANLPGAGEWRSELHEAVGEALWVGVTLHIGLVAVWSLLRRRDLVTPMWTGRIPGPGPDLVASDRRWLAVVMIACVIGFWGYMLASGGAPA